jgi:hypothetical protein
LTNRILDAALLVRLLDMAMGLEMLLQSLGFDPKELENRFTEARSNIQTTLDHFEARLNAIDKKLDAILAATGAKVEESIHEERTGQSDGRHGGNGQSVSIGRSGPEPTDNALSGRSAEQSRSGSGGITRALFRAARGA